MTQLVTTWIRTDGNTHSLDAAVATAIGSAYQADFDLDLIVHTLRERFNRYLSPAGIEFVGTEFFADLQRCDRQTAVELVDMVHAAIMNDDQHWNELLDASALDDLPPAAT